MVRIEWKECVTPQEAIELESVLLLEHRPPFNRAGVWKGDPWFLKIESSADRLHLELVREEGETGPHPPAFRYVLGSLSKLEGMPLEASESQQEYWQEELERLKKYATKAQKLRKATELKPAAIPA